MIHISTEELFRRIRTENNCEFVDEQANQIDESHNFKLDLEHDSSDTSAGHQFEDSTRTRRKSSPRFGQTSSGNQQWQQQGEFCRDMSSIFPTTCGPVRDSNNNNTAASPAEDEVQAVLITGCGSKIGSNIAVAFAARGLKVALVDFDIKQTEAVANECREKSPKNRAPLQIVADISQLAEAHKVIDRTIEAFGRLDVLVNTVNNAGLIEAKFAASGDDDPHVFEQYHKIIANNMHAVTYLCISAAPYLRKTRGSIVNVSSITNRETGSYKFAYRMSKAGISTLTKCLATDLAPDIKVICVSPKSDATET